MIPASQIKNQHEKRKLRQHLYKNQGFNQNYQPWILVIPLSQRVHAFDAYSLKTLHGNYHAASAARSGARRNIYCEESAKSTIFIF